MISSILYLLSSSGLFLIYFTVFLIFGNIFLEVFKENNEKKTILENILKSFGIGAAMHLSISTLTISFGFFSFYTAYLPFILIDFVYIILKVLKNKENIQERLQNLTRDKFIEKITH